MAAIFLHDDMAQLTGHAVAPQHHLSVAHDAAADARAQSNHDEVLHAFRHAILHLAHGGGVGIVGQAHGDAQTL